ncbi:prolyl oligopeptidase family serine peptidase [Gemmatimonadota bacterium]
MTSRSKRRTRRSITIILVVVTMTLNACASLRSEEGPLYRHLFQEGTVNGESLDWTISYPDSYQEGTPTPLILALHFGGTPSAYYGSSFTNILVLPGLGELEAVILSPTCPAELNWWDEAMDGAVMALIDTVRSQFTIDDDRIVVTGFSFGGIGTWYFAGTHPDIFCAAIPVASRVSEEFIEQIEGIPLYVIHSNGDEVLPYADMAQRVTTLQSRGVDVTLKTVNGTSHYNTAAFARPLKTAMAWLRERW